MYQCIYRTSKDVNNVNFNIYYVCGEVNDAHTNINPLHFDKHDTPVNKLCVL